MMSECSKNVSICLHQMLKLWYFFTKTGRMLVYYCSKRSVIKIETSQLNLAKTVDPN